MSNMNKQSETMRQERVTTARADNEIILADTQLREWREAITTEEVDGERTRTHVLTADDNQEEGQNQARIRAAYAPVSDPGGELKRTWVEHLSQEVTLEELDAYLKSKKGNSAPGPTETQYAHLRNAPECTKRLICTYVRAMLLTEAEWDPRAVHSTIVFIRKKAGATLRSFRPITLQQALTKVVTGILAKRMAAAVAGGSGALDALQQGFIPGGSVGTPIQILNGVLEDARRQRDEGKGRGEVHVCFYDFSNAYTTVPPWALEIAMRRLHMPQAVITRMVSLVRLRATNAPQCAHREG
jgi:hypothetical protein